MINGRTVIRDGELLGGDLPSLVQAHQAAHRRLLARAGLL
jgi:hypothetical protein